MFYILDEIGRGTSTFDGIALAKSIASYITKNIKARTLFATHYLELTTLANNHREINNICSTVSEHDHKITFLHKIRRGKANNSYGIFVGEIAGLPPQVIEEAKKHLRNLSKKPIEKDHQPDLYKDNKRFICSIS